VIKKKKEKKKLIKNYFLLPGFVKGQNVSFSRFKHENGGKYKQKSYAFSISPFNILISSNASVLLLGAKKPLKKE